MKKITLSILIFFLYTISSYAQSVGLVLSGGGAKGMTHIGVIRALEENDIPIDYITGTSMGAIIGALYAMGYSPDDMTRLIKSENFKRWYTGEVEDKYVYFFKKMEDTPSFIKLNLAISKDSTYKVENSGFSLNAVDPIQMNLAFLQLFTQSTAASKNNFNQLFVPFRCIASDVYNKKKITFKDGDLGDAVRASMTFPGAFKPIEIDSVIVYDGGIYDNFPKTAMKQDFNPDIIIGSVVARNPDKPKGNDIMNLLENLVMQKTDYSLNPEDGILLKFKYDDVQLLDFDRIDELSRNGYDYTTSLMDSIQKRVHRRIPRKKLNQKRTEFKKQLKPLLFKHVFIKGVSPEQKKTIEDEFHSFSEETFTFEDLKKAYFRLLSSDIVVELIPHAVYNYENSTFDLHLNVRLRKNITVAIGGSVSSTESSQIYFGLSYQSLDKHYKRFILNGYVGKVYNNIQFSSRIDYPSGIPVSYQFIASVSSFDFFKTDHLFTKSSTPSFCREKEQFIKFRASLPFVVERKADFTFGLGHIEDNYSQSSLINLNTNNVYDTSHYYILGGNIALRRNSLNHRQFATSGHKECIQAGFYTAHEKFIPGQSTTQAETENDATWLQFKYQDERYYHINDKFVLGSYLEAYYSTRNFSSNYKSTVLQSGHFAPTYNSKITYNESFSSNHYLGLGVRPILKINDLFHLRAEVYGFLPFYHYIPEGKHGVQTSSFMTRFEYLSEASLVCHLPFAAIRAFVNHYSEPKDSWAIGLSIGWQLFNERYFR
jgi:NTE family protein